MERRTLLQGLLGSWAVCLISPGQARSQNPILKVTCSYEGSINAGSLVGRGLGRIDTSAISPHDVTVTYEDLPTTFHPFAVGASFITIGLAGARRHGKALNLWDLSHGNYAFDRVLTWKQFPGSRVTVRADVVTTGLNFHLSAAYEGIYKGPTDLATVLLWEGVMTQVEGSNDVHEVGRAVIQRRNKDTFEVEWESTYRNFYRKMNVPKQYATMTADLLTFSDNKMHMVWTSDVSEDNSKRISV